MKTVASAENQNKGDQKKLKELKAQETARYIEQSTLTGIWIHPLSFVKNFQSAIPAGLGTLLADQEVEPTRNVQHMLHVATTDAWSQEKYAGAFDSSEGFASTLPGPVCRPLPLLGVAPCVQGLRQRLSHYHRLNG